MFRYSILAAAVTLAACTTGAPAPTDVACSVFLPIAYSATSDTPATIRDIRNFNARLRSLCPALFPKVAQ